MKRSEPRRLSEIIERAIEASGQSTTFAEQELLALWPEIVGPGINKLTTRRFIQSGVLHVYLTSAVVKNELMFQRKSLVDALNGAVGKEVIDDIKIH